MSYKSKVCITCSRKQIGQKRVKKQCITCTAEFMAIHPNSIYCSINCKNIGNSKLDKWVAQKRLMDKDNSKCYICGGDSNIANHHIIQRINNGQETVTLCRQHHILIHKFMWLLTNKGYKIIKINP